MSKEKRRYDIEYYNEVAVLSFLDIRRSQSQESQMPFTLNTHLKQVIISFVSQGFIYMHNFQQTFIISPSIDRALRMQASICELQFWL